MTKDNYLTLESPSEGLYKEKSSKFLGFAYPINSENDIKDLLDQLKKDHFKARHHCYAYRLGYDGSQFRANDDGEPSGTAGKPILGQIDKRSLTNVLVVVVRYYGGIKLGTSGLIRAYRSSAEDALDKAITIVKTQSKEIKLSFSYSHMGDIMNITKKLNLSIHKKHFEEAAFIILSVPRSKVNETIKSIYSSLDNRELADISDDYTSDKIRIEFL